MRKYVKVEQLDVLTYDVFFSFFNINSEIKGINDKSSIQRIWGSESEKREGRT